MKKYHDAVTYRNELFGSGNWNIVEIKDDVGIIYSGHLVFSPLENKITNSSNQALTFCMYTEKSNNNYSVSFLTAVLHNMKTFPYPEVNNIPSEEASQFFKKNHSRYKISFENLINDFNPLILNSTFRVFRINENEILLDDTITKIVLKRN